MKQLEGHDCSVLRLLWISESQVASSASDGLVKVLLILQTFGLWDVWSRLFLVFFPPGGALLCSGFIIILLARTHPSGRPSSGTSHQKGGMGHAALGQKSWGGGEGEGEAMASVELRRRLVWTTLRGGTCGGAG